MKTNRALDLTDYLENELFEYDDTASFETVEVDERYDEEAIPARLLDTNPSDEYTQKVGEVFHFFYPDTAPVRLVDLDDIEF